MAGRPAFVHQVADPARAVWQLEQPLQGQTLWPVGTLDSQMYSNLDALMSVTDAGFECVIQTLHDFFDPPHIR